MPKRVMMMPLQEIPQEKKEREVRVCQREWKEGRNSKLTRHTQNMCKEVENEERIVFVNIL